MVGGISASWLHREPGGRTPGEILHLEPSTHRGLSYISLAERIMGLPDLKVLYPNKPKNQVFSKYIQVGIILSRRKIWSFFGLAIHCSLDIWINVDKEITSMSDLLF